MNEFERIFNLFEEGKYLLCKDICHRLLQGCSCYGYYPWFYLGKVEYELGEFKKAEVAFKKAIELAPNEDQILLSLACVYEQQGRILTSLKTFRQEAKMFPKTKASWIALAKFLQRNKRFEAAIRVFEFAKLNFDLRYEEYALEYAKSLYEGASIEAELLFLKELLDSDFDEEWVQSNYDLAILDSPPTPTPSANDGNT